MMANPRVSQTYFKSHRAVATFPRCLACPAPMEAPRTVDEVHANFSRRRDGLVKALTRGTNARARRSTDSHAAQPGRDRDAIAVARRSARRSARDANADDDADD
jgi:hypothetical protein